MKTKMKWRPSTAFLSLYFKKRVWESDEADQHKEYYHTYNTVNGKVEFEFTEVYRKNKKNAMVFDRAIVEMGIEKSFIEIEDITYGEFVTVVMMLCKPIK